MKERIMAIPVFKGRVSPLFDVSSNFEIIEFENCRVIKTSEISLDSSEDINRLEKLINSGIDIIICSAISKPYADYILSKDIVLIPGVIGQVDEVINAYLSDRLVIDCFAMPGYRWRAKGKEGGRRRRQCLRYRDIQKLNKQEDH